MVLERKKKIYKTSLSIGVNKYSRRKKGLKTTHVIGPNQFVLIFHYFTSNFFSFDQSFIVGIEVFDSKFKATEAVIKLNKLRDSFVLDKTVFAIIDFDDIKKYKGLEIKNMEDFNLFCS